ncbi:NAD(P)/FAD-dependent oxidoreductase [Chondrinema litorale]|uniref:NAD(P)/FAD-dependent oxidoreductase n=1 Tax=Chondrinema litorale TaxID=2994555 RepID=UPI002543BA56|nr:NAD(P)/FAD-dependent oxidoreductase [Chondrinema litorale]UZR92340.1 NAD(P)/FAD-dependent oxidoreductase [Chondrinema litorale]
MIETDILIIGAGPCGLFTVFEAGLIKLKCHLIDALPIPGGQCAEIYPKKPIYDIPGYPEILAGDLVDRLMEQAAPFKPGFTLGERAQTLEKLPDGRYKLTTNKGTEHVAPVIAIAGGLGCFEPRKPPIPNLESFEDKGVEYIIKDPEFYRDKKVVLAGGGDSALDWAIYLSKITTELTLIHRRKAFRGALDSVEKVMNLAESGDIKLLTDSEVIGLSGNGSLDGVVVKHKTDGELTINADHYVPLFGLSPKLGPISDWNLNIDKNAIEVNTLDYSTNIPGIYAIGDINTYEGKLKLILCGFHEATLMVQSAYKYINPGKNITLKYTTVNGVAGF